MIRVLVTGSTGFIGRRTTALLRGTATMEVITMGGRASRATDADVVGVDVRDRTAVRRLMARIHPSIVIHLAGALPQPGTSDDELRSSIVDGTRTLSESAVEHGARRFVLASSAAVYGDQQSGPIAEDAPLSASGTYCAAKIDAERIVAEALDLSPTSGVCVRLFNVHGDPQGPSLPDRLLRSTPATPVTLRAPERFIRDYLHVDDAARAVVAAAVRGTDRAVCAMNAGTGVGLTSAALVEHLSRDAPVHVDEVDGAPSSSVADTTFAQRQFGFAARSRFTPAIA